jgi:plasmid stabilization system protein ParE
MRVRFALSTIWELTEIGQYISARNPQGALRVEAAIRRAVASLETMQRRGRKQRQRAIRKIGVGKYPYNIFYHIDETQQIVTIINIRHAARKRKYRDT